MECGVGSPEAAGVCIQLAKRWLQVLLDGAGIGALALLVLGFWILGYLRRNIARQEKELAQANELRRYAEDSARHAEHRAQLAAVQEERSAKQVEELKQIIATGENDVNQRLKETQRRFLDISERMNNALRLASGGAEPFWTRPLGQHMNDYAEGIVGSIPILMFANQKGGVGKTTTMTNLAACFSMRGERVLTVDLDYQGSHSRMMLLQSGQGRHEPESLVDHAFADELDPDWRGLTIRRAADNLYYIPSFYNFEAVERSVEYAWTLGSTKDDARYRLARVLLSKEVQTNFDRVLIDAPPRFTLGFVNGFCASTHLYAPTVVDHISALAIELFGRRFRELKTLVNPHIRWPGIIGTLTSNNPKNLLALPSTAEGAADEAEHYAQRGTGSTEPVFIRNPVLRRDPSLARAAEKGIPYLNESAVRPMFDALATVIESKAPSRRTRR